MYFFRICPYFSQLQILFTGMGYALTRPWKSILMGGVSARPIPKNSISRGGLEHDLPLETFCPPKNPLIGVRMHQKNDVDIFSFILF